jgi:hypothetical protein
MPAGTGTYFPPADSALPCLALYLIGDLRQVFLEALS